MLSLQASSSLRSLLTFLTLLINVPCEALHPATRKAMKNHAAANVCDVCGLTFTKPLDWEKHLNGKRHATNLKTYVAPEQMYQEYLLSAPHWALSTAASSYRKTRNDYKKERAAERLDSGVGDSAVDMGSEQTKRASPEEYTQQLTLNVSRLWSNDELSTLQLKFRATCLHPSTMMKHLYPYQKARIWRYLRDAMGVGHYTEVATIMAAVDGFIGEGDSGSDDDNGDDDEGAEGSETKGQGPAGPGSSSSSSSSSSRDKYAKRHASVGFLRIKEIFESFEIYRTIATFVLAAEKRSPVPRIVELGAGHGLVGILLAYRFPHIEVIMLDRARRGIFDIFVECWERHGHESPCLARYSDAAVAEGSSTHRVLPNVRFIEGDIMQADDASTILPNSVVVCVHGCNEVNQLSIEMAEARGAAWIVVPCCIRREMYLQCDVLVESDDVRHAVMCGALASRYTAQYMGEIDKRITNRGIVIGGGVGAEAPPANGKADSSSSSSSSTGVPLKYRGNLPKLSFS